jgi:hypothetical protein
MSRALSFIVILFASLADPALAIGPATGGTLNRSVTDAGAVPKSSVPKPAPTPTDWTQETEATCGMACRYHRANDNLTMQALYLVTKIQKVDDDLQGDEKDSTNGAPAARVAIGPVCKSDSEDIHDCFDRYKDFQRVALLKIRQAIGANEDAIARLTANRNLDGTVTGTSVVYDSGQKAPAYLPDVPTLSELEAAYVKGNLKPSGATYARADVQKWSEDLIRPDPKAPFLQFTKNPVSGNPYEKQSADSMLYMESRSAAGTPTGLDPRIKADLKKAQASLEGYAKDRTVSKDPVTVIAPTKNLKSDDAITYDAFKDARSEINSKLDASVQAGDKNRKPANDPKKKATPGGDPSAAVSKDIQVNNLSETNRSPSAKTDYDPDQKVQRPPDMQNSRYIRYDLSDMLQEIEDATATK